MMKHLKKHAAIIAAAIMVTSLTATSYTYALKPNNGNSAAALEQSYINRLKKRISTEKLIDGVDKLATGDDARISGSEGEIQAASNIAKQFKSFGLKTEIREFDLGRAVSYGKGTLSVGDKTYKVESFNGGTSFKKDFNKKLVYVGFGNSDEEYTSCDVNDKVVIVKRTGPGDDTYANKIDLANKYGAAALIVFDSRLGDTVPWFSAGESKIPILGITSDDGEDLVNELKKDPNLTLTPNIDIKYKKNGVSRNVVAEIPAAKNPEKAKTLVVGAHFDSVNCPGANDNASGTSVLMETARLLSTPDMKKAFNYNIQFVAFGTEELGLAGSEAFVKELEKTGEIENVQAVINMDMVGNGDHMRIIQFEKSEIYDISKIAEEQVKKNDLKYFGKVLQGSTRSDHYSFEKAGLPALTLMVAWDNNYHTDRDNMDNVKPVHLYDTSRLLVSTIIDMQDMAPRVHTPSTKKVKVTNVLNDDFSLDN